ncbi:MAG TPA: S9 family peptidase [Fermentimonas caenicola]|jgi:oligopeptidase B|uniref:S9 family peptidase n=1 Tax=Lascolabacillus sp. TaxID=1924068 RepID=UPI00182A5761|nr:S9 family peptidase [Lascolabacillus sp.]MBP6174664.1 S9 family peptidase [Fermentimonas sp.]HHU40957.1 S9 family peptidase [Fermentimonas caenicola]MBP6195934.1 S9 family peptidase [Fermentimonas sp.]MDD2606207.1 S9 family peptidase [Lascolabacillus sp.]MDD3657261.1 S9 family peptidase [Lascolabacillus sp.]
MKQLYLTIIYGMIMITACNTNKEEVKILKQSDFPAPPVAEVVPDTFENFGQKRIDNYYWLKDKNNPKVIEYLNAENEYTESVMASTKELQQTIYDEILGRIKEDDESYPSYINGYWYYSRTEKGKQYRTYLRRKGSLDAEEEVIFDVNKMAEGKSAFIFAGYSVSPDNNKVAYLFNETGSYAEYVMKIKDLNTDEEIGFTVIGATSVTWANDNNTLFYGVIDQTLRPYQIHRRGLNEHQSTLIYEEKDAKFRTYVSGTKTKEYIFIGSASSTTSEERYISADRPLDEFKVFMPRVKDVEYSVFPHKEKFFVSYKDRENLNSMIYEVPLTGYEDKSTWKVFLPHDDDARLEGIDIVKDYISVELRREGLTEIIVMSLNGGDTKKIVFPEPVYSASMGGNPEYEATTIRYTYTSLNRPTTLYEYNILTGESIKLKEQEVPSGFNPDDYTVERLWATAPDGVLVPMAIVYKNGLKKDGSNPALIYSYGSYGYSTDVHFSASMYSLIDRGFVYAIAQIRGGSDLGEQWYEDGKLLNKKNTFTDFIACSEKLINDGYTSSDKLAAMGGSAGGLLMGAVSNMRPDLYQTIVAQVPFVDVINTMLDDTLPLTTGEYEEWGNPNEEEYYNYILSYSPYDNISAQDYPNILVTGGINDSQVLFHEPAKYTAKLRALKTDNNILILKMNMESGHGGATGRYEGIKETAFDFAFILNRVGIYK